MPTHILFFVCFKWTVCRESCLPLWGSSAAELLFLLALSRAVLHSDGMGEGRRERAMLVKSGLHPMSHQLGNKALQLGSSWQGSKAGEQERRWEPGKTLAVPLFWRGWHLQTWWQRLNIKVWGTNCNFNLNVCIYFLFSHHCSDHLFEHNASSHPKMLFWHNQPEHYHHHQYPTSNSSYLR